MTVRASLILSLLVTVLLGLSTARVSAAVLESDGEANRCVVNAIEGHETSDAPSCPLGDEDATPASAEEILDADATIACDNVAFCIDLRLFGYHGSDELLYEAPHGELSVPPVL